MHMRRPLRCFIAGLLVLVSVALSGEAHADDAASEKSAEAVAEAVAERTGDPSSVERLAFTFVVERGGDEKLRRRHVWWPKEGRLEVHAGDSVIELDGLHDHDLTAAEKPQQNEPVWREVAADADPKRAAEAWSWFINDSYWLLAPAKLFDPGVDRHLDDQDRLVLTFDGVGLTPGDRYKLTVDRHRHVVTRWQYDLQSGREGTFRWTDYREVGPLYLSTKRVSTDTDPETVIRFEDLEAQTAP